MKGTKDNTAYLWAIISPSEKQKAKEIARKENKTFQGWLGEIIREELKKYPEEIIHG